VWLTRLERDLDNLRAAMTWAREQREVELGLRIAAALSVVFFNWGDLREGLHWLEGLLALALPDGPSERAIAVAIDAGFPGWVLAKALQGAGGTIGCLGEFGRGERVLEQSLALSRRLGDRKGEGIALFFLANLASLQYDFVRAEALYEESLPLLRQTGARESLVSALNNLADVWRFQGDYGRAQALLEEALPPAHELGNGVALHLVLATLGEVARERADYPRALALQREALGLPGALGHVRPPRWEGRWSALA
jgi:tetratricopeptide (TPR) repeat protein